jgi:hypothetical protein
MKNNFHENELLSYLYDESNVYDCIAIEEALDQDTVLSARFDLLQESHRELLPLQLQPSESAVQAILAYSRSARLEEEVFGA